MSAEEPPRAGHRRADRRVRVDRPLAQYFRYTAPGVLRARPEASRPTTASGRLWASARRILIGPPLTSEQEAEERLSKKKALAIFSSDAISSSAYATEEILRVLIVAGAAALSASLWIALAIAGLLAAVATSYRQIGHAYPSGGGAYAVARANFGLGAAIVAAGALLVDYVMTVAVSTSSAVEQITSAVPALEPGRVAIGVAAIALITLANLRGVRESGNIFAIPTYLFIGGTLLMIGIGLVRVALGDGGGAALGPRPQPLEAVGAILLLRAFAAGSVALTGTEAIANGVQAFEPPEATNAARTLTAMAVLLGVLFVGITFLVDRYGITPSGPGGGTVVAQLATTVYGPGSPGFYAFQLVTALILFLAANTSFNAFPRLAAILARDGLMPRHFAFRGDRLAYTVGILLLGAVASVLVIVFGGRTTALIPLYSVGVFVAFTISQAGMVRHWLAVRGPGWRRRLAVNGVGAGLTGVVAVVVTAAKAPDSLLVAVMVPGLAGLMLLVRREYSVQASDLAVRPDVVIGPPRREERVIVPVPEVNRAVVQAVTFGRSISENVIAVHVTDDLQAGSAFRNTFTRQMPGVALVIVESPYRAVVEPLVAYLEASSSDPDLLTIVVLPEFVPRHWWDQVLFNQVAGRLRRALIGRPNTVVSMVPYRRDR